MKRRGRINRKDLLRFSLWYNRGRQERKKESLFMAAAYLPSILVPLVGLVFPAIAMASLFLYIEKEEIV